MIIIAIAYIVCCVINLVSMLVMVYSDYVNSAKENPLTLTLGGLIAFCIMVISGPIGNVILVCFAREYGIFEKTLFEFYNHQNSQEKK